MLRCSIPYESGVLCAQLCKVLWWETVSARGDELTRWRPVMSRARRRSCSVLKKIQYALIALDPQRYCGLWHSSN